MGCFNTTCFVTNQTIAPNDKVYLIPITPSKDYHNRDVVIKKSSTETENVQVRYPYNTNTYADCFWQPLGHVFKATYNDYGNFIFEEQDLQDIPEGFANFVDGLLEVPLTTLWNKETSHRDNSFDLLTFYNKEKLIREDLESSNKFLEYISKAINNNSCFYKIPWVSEKPTAVAYAVCSEYAMEYAIEVYTKEIEDTECEYSLYNKFQRKIKRILERNETLKNNFSDLEIAWAISDTFKPRSVHIKVPFHKDKTQFFITKYETNFDEAFEELYSYIVSNIPMFFLEKLLEDVNVKYSPMVYTGQDYQNDIGNAYLKMITEVNQKIKDDLPLEDDEYFDEDDVE